MITINPVHPWIRGFVSKLSFCRVCGAKGSLAFLGERDKDTESHLYKCYKCGSEFANPTKYAFCEKDNSMIESDSFYNPCIHGKCVNYSPVAEGNTRCKHIRAAKEEDVERRDLLKIGETLRNVKIQDQKGLLDDTGQKAGLTGEYIKAKRERIKKLEEAEKK